MNGSPLLGASNVEEMLYLRSLAEDEAEQGIPCPSESVLRRGRAEKGQTASRTINRQSSVTLIEQRQRDALGPTLAIQPKYDPIATIHLQETVA